MSVVRALLLFVLVVDTGCDRTDHSTSDPPTRADAKPGAQTKPRTKADSSPTAEPEEPGPPAARGGTDELHELEGMTEAQLLARFGKPDHERAFEMADCCHEFEIELYNTYPPDKGHDHVQIHEWTWDYDGYKLTVWTHESGDEWVALDTIRYADGVEF